MNVTIVGAGVIGCAVAHEFATRGARVRVIDPRGVGLGATRASAGILAPQTEGHIPALLSLGTRSLSLYDDFIARVSADAAQTIEYARTGTLHIAASPAENDELGQIARALIGSQVDHVLLDAAQARALEPAVTDKTTRALHNREQGYVAVTALTGALAAAAARRGATFEMRRVLGIEGGDEPRAITDDGPARTERLIVAAGSWSSGLAGAPQPPAVKPIRGQLLQLKLPQRPASRVIWGSRCYLVPWSDGTVLVGATVEDAGFDENATAAGVQHLLDAALELMPPLRDATFDGVRVGLRPMTKDELPAVGPSSTMRHVFYATGHYRNGVLLAPLTARLLADLVLEGKADEHVALMRPDRLGL